MGIGKREKGEEIKISTTLMMNLSGKNEERGGGFGKDVSSFKSRVRMFTSMVTYIGMAEWRALGGGMIGTMD